jgi:3-hydroxypropanoate dehydrogenase
VTTIDVENDATPASADALTLDPAAAELLFRAARTANTFADEPVTDDQVRAIYDLVKWAPTSMNTQPLRITLVRSPEARKRLVAHLMPGNQAKTASAPLVAVLSADRNFHDHLPTVFPHNPGARDYFLDAGARESFAGFNGALQVGYFILGIRAAGLAAGPMTGYNGPALEAEIFPDGDQKLLAVINIGKPGPDAWFDRSPRLAYDQVVRSI